MRALIAIAALLLTAAASPAEDPLVVAVAHRSGRIQFFDANVSPLGTMAVNQNVESITASPDGRRLYVAQDNPMKPGAGGLFSLDLATREMCLLSASAMFGAPSADGRYVFTQTKRGVNIFDAGTLSQTSIIKAKTSYNLQPSPDGRWLLGVANAPEASSVDIFSVHLQSFARTVPFPLGPVTGAWVGNRFYLFSYLADGVPNKGMLCSLDVEHGEEPRCQPMPLPDLHADCNQPLLLTLTGGPDRLYLAEAFGFKVDRRLACPDAARGGIYAIRTASGHFDFIAPTVRVYRMAVSPDGRDLYVIEAGGPSPLNKPRLLRIDARTGHVQNAVTLEAGDWSLALARTPPALILRGNIRATMYCNH